MIRNEKKNNFILSLIDTINLAFLFVLIGFLIAIRDKNPHTNQLFVLYFILTIIIIAIAFWRSKKPEKSLNTFYLISATVIFVLLYESISGLLPVFAGTNRYDMVIDKLDKSIFGISPTVWMQSMINPVFTEVLYILYVIYFLLPVLLIVLLFRDKKYLEVEISLFVLFVDYYGAYISYFFIPVEGPGYFLAHEHTESLQGIFLSAPIRDLISYFEPSTLDCFPSLHASILTVITMLSARYYRRLFIPFLFLSVIIIFSLVYLRYHYILDILTGILWAVISVYGGTWIYQKWSSYFPKMMIH